MLIEQRDGIRPLRLEVSCRAEGCDRLAGLVNVPTWDDCQTNTNVRQEPDGRILRPDLHLRRDHRLVLAFEICHTHPVDEGKAAASTYPWTEILAGHVIAVHKHRVQEGARLRLFTGNVGVLTDPRCLRCRLEERPVIDDKREDGPFLRYPGVNLSVRALRSQLVETFVRLKAGAQTLRLYGHLCKECRHPLVCEVSHEHFDRVEGPWTDPVGNDWDVALLRGIGDRVRCGLGVMIASTNAFSGLDSDPGKPLRDGTREGTRWMTVPHNVTHPPGGFLLSTHAMRPESFRCLHCAEVAAAKARAAEQERLEAQRLERIARFRAREAQKEAQRRQAEAAAAAAAAAEAERLLELERQRRLAWLAVMRPSLIRLAAVLTTRRDQLLAAERAREARERRRRERKEAAELQRQLASKAHQRRLQAVAALERDLLATSDAVVRFDWPAWQRQLAAATSIAAYDAIVNAAAESYAATLARAEQAIESLVNVSKRDLATVAAPLSAKYASWLPALRKLRTDPAKEALAFQERTAADRKPLEVLERLRGIVRAWATIPHGDEFTFTEEEHALRDQMVSTLLSLGSYGPPWVRRFDRSILNAGLLASKVRARAHIAEVAQLMESDA